ncbi:hypothetical protein AtubIFM56815_004603 [Aspergillus tubingensis]|uniref:Uncharacterized protein n=2 Tax=Aspergillus subgen. Circumdati TaxID=2720871 RepID=A0A100IP04_ASPNG|nr:uncharacterized protein AtWU_07194 [Aspergillus tubingensis]GAQ44716.1 hypothetical protein ABL_07377 [Aspergillus niger]GFN17392.1 hypothetical protein AtWU_07194 [Aspergillus tubingensis]GLA80971.1 hypothetical protein AtubIFM56815_004603 [Aspergillus tubingensis]GLB17923.1 hypothetical protein AtubIFM61612_007813 [Aspergillus tubingensis]
MKTILTALLLTVSSLAAAQSVCPDGTSPQCCVDDYLDGGVSYCTDPSRAPTSTPDLTDLCFEQLKAAKCCATSTLGQDLKPTCSGAF